MFHRQCIAFKEIQARGVIKLADVLRLRRDYFPGGALDEAGAQALLELNASCPIQDTAWTTFLVETVCGYIIHAAQPTGYLTAGKARWLLGHATKGGRIERLSCLELLMTALETARWAPSSLSAFVLRQIEIDIVTGQGPLRLAATSGKGRVGPSEAALIRRVLAAGDTSAVGGRGAITRAEAEVLLDIHDATSTAANCLQWTELFTKAIANAVMTASGYQAPGRAKVLQPEPWFNPSSLPEDFLDMMTSRGFRAVLAGYAERTQEQAALDRLEHQKVEIITAEAIAQIEPDWLAARMGRPSTLTPPTRALLSHLRQAARPLHPALQTLVDKAA